MIFVPLWDVDNPLRVIRFQWVTTALILANVVIYFAFQSGLLLTMSTEAQMAFALIPSELVNESLLRNVAVPVAPEPIQVPEALTLISYMFLHGNLLHLGGNMLFLWVFGDNVEDAMGHFRFLAFYLLCGAFAALTHALMATQSDVPLIGASGGVAGVIAAYLMLHPNVRVWCLALFRIPIRISAALALGVWIVLQVVNVVFATEGQTAWWAHIGGLVAGAVLVIFMRRRGVPLFDRPRLVARQP